MTLANGDNVLVCVFNKKLPGTLIIKKVNDGGAASDGFTADITGGTQNIAFSASSPSAAQTLANGAYTLTEDPKTDYVYKGWSVVTDNATCPSSAANPSASASVTIADGQTKTLCFYNQKRVNVKVVKTEVGLIGSTPGQGWKMTISGCTFTDTQPTAGSDGSYTWTNLAPCTYTVSEDTSSKAGFTANDPAPKTVNATGTGQTYIVTFTNTKIIIIPECIVGCFTILETPTPVLPTPTATPTARPTEKPKETVTEIVAGEKTPGPGAISTPIAPSAGTGATASGSGTDSILLGIAGLIIASGGLIMVSASRRKRS